jgi:hypothetical protein
MRIIIHKDHEGYWRATRDAKLELAAPTYRSAVDLARWCRKKYPLDYVGVITKDIGPKTASLTEGAVLWLSKVEARWPWLGGGSR